MITIKTELNSIADFEAWSGGKDRLDKVIEKNLIDTVDGLLEEIFFMNGEEIPTDTELNDYLWFQLEDDLKEMYEIDLWE